MNRNSRNYRWLMGFETKRVVCPDGKLRNLTFRDYIHWQDAWSRKDKAALEKFDSIHGPGTTGSITVPEPRESRDHQVSVLGCAGMAISRGIAASLKSRGHA